MPSTLLVQDRGLAPQVLITGAFAGANPSAVFTAQAANFAAASGTAYELDSSASPVEATLPAAPVDGDKVALKLDALANAVTVASGGAEVASGASPWSVPVTLVGKTLVFEYSLTANDWTYTEA